MGLNPPHHDVETHVRFVESHNLKPFANSFYVKNCLDLCEVLDLSDFDLDDFNVIDMNGKKFLKCSQNLKRGNT